MSHDADSLRWSSKLKKTLALLFLAFVTLFLVRFALGFAIEFKEDTPRKPAAARLGSGSFNFSTYRYDVGNNFKQLGIASFEAAPAPAEALAALNVYSREARIGAATTNYDNDVQRALQIIRQHQAEVRLENASGVKPHRQYTVVVRVPEEKFHNCSVSLQKVGELRSFDVTTEDKSDEVRQKFAERDALRAHIESLTKLRSAEGKVSELTSLERQILEVEKEVQSLNVSLGEFVKKESFNNVNFSLTEEIAFYVDHESFPLSARLVAALVWTVRWYSAALSMIVFLAATIYAVKVVRVG